MNLTSLRTIEQIKAFLEGTSDVSFKVTTNESSRRQFIQTTLNNLRYLHLQRVDRGIVLRFMEHVSQYSRQHIDRLISQYKESRVLAPKSRKSKSSFHHKYTPEDVRLLA